VLVTNGAWLRQQRMRAGYAEQRSFALAVGVSRSAVANWENDIGKPSMAHAEKISTLIGRPRSEVLARFGYPIGGGLPEVAMGLPPEWLTAIQAAVSAGVAEGVAQALAELRREGLIETPPRSGVASRQRRCA